MSPFLVPLVIFYDISGYLLETWSNISSNLGLCSTIGSPYKARSVDFTELLSSKGSSNELSDSMGEGGKGGKGDKGGAVDEVDARGVVGGFKGGLWPPVDEVDARGVVGGFKGGLWPPVGEMNTGGAVDEVDARGVVGGIEGGLWPPVLLSGAV